MQIRKLKFLWTPGQIVQVWQKRDGYRSISLGDDVDIDNVPDEDVEVIHGAFAAALDLPCRPRTYEEMLAGHTREGLALLTGDAPSTDVWTLTVVDHEDTPEPHVSVHATERDAEDALRYNYAATQGDDLVGDELFAYVASQNTYASIERHDRP